MSTFEDRLGLLTVFWVAKGAPEDMLGQIEAHFGTFGREQFIRLMKDYEGALKENRSMLQ
jgi:hypothetical protein